MYLSNISALVENTLAEPLEGASFALSLSVVGTEDGTKEDADTLASAIAPAFRAAVVNAANKGEESFKWSTVKDSYTVVADVTSIDPQ